MSDSPPPAAPPPMRPPLDAQPLPVPALSQPYYGAPLGAAFLRFWRKYATFTGRASRAEFWWWALAWFVINAVASLALSLVSATPGGGSSVGVTVFRTVFSAAAIVPFAALTWRRLHDANLSGWWAAPYLAGTVLQLCLTPFGIELAVTPAAQSNPVTSVASIVMSILDLVFAVQLLVLVVRPSNPAGARFDA